MANHYNILQGKNMFTAPLPTADDTTLGFQIAEAAHLTEMSKTPAPILDAIYLETLKAICFTTIQASYPTTYDAAYDTNAITTGAQLFIQQLQVKLNHASRSTAPIRTTQAEAEAAPKTPSRRFGAGAAAPAGGSPGSPSAFLARKAAITIPTGEGFMPA
jgi:hypothetical protein